MTSGIYLLRWDGTPYFYIGKSVNMKERLSQHFASFEEGTAASKLQWAYEAFGEPTIRVLAECHRDNIDVIEAYYISYYKSDFMLNTAMLPYPFEGISEEVIEEVLSNYAQLSLGEFSRDYYTTIQEKEALKQDLAEAEHDISVLKYSRNKQELEADVRGRIKDLMEQLKSTEESLSESLLHLSKAETRLNEIYNLPWYKKIFVKPQ